jgi:predicted transcriptional regulator
MAARNLTGLGVALKTLRKSAGMTLDDVSGLAGVSTNYLSRAENGLVEPSPGWVEIVVSAIGDRLAAAAKDAA